MPVYKRPNGRWLVRVWTRGRPLTWIVEGSKKDALNHEAKKRAELAVDSGDPHSAPTFSALCRSHYLPHSKLRLRPTWYNKHRYIVATLMQHFADCHLRDIDAPALESFARGRSRDGLNATSVNNEMRVMRRVLAYAVERGWIASVPRYAPLHETGRDRVEAWTLDELQRLYSCCGPRLLPVVVLLANTGMRKGEALALTWERVDLERRMIEVWPSSEWQPKNGRPREVPISDALMPYLSGPHASRFVFPSSRKHKGQDAPGRLAFWPQRDFDAARDAAGLRGGPHTLRHTFASMFLASCPDIYLLARILGHSDVSTTRLYSHLLPDHLARARNVVNLAPSMPMSEVGKNRISAVFREASAGGAEGRKAE